MSTIKSGTLLKQVQGFLSKDWKPKHCVLYSDGEFSVYQSITDATAETRINLKTDVRSIETGSDCGSVTLPKSRSRDVDSLFGVFGNEKKPHYFLSTRETECREWVIALDRIINQPLPSKSCMAPPGQPPPYTSRIEYEQNVNADPPNNSSSRNQTTNTGGAAQQNTQPPPPQMGQPRPQMGQPQPMMYPQQPPMYGQQPMYGYGQQPMYGPPMYGQPMYQQPVYVQQAPQQQQSRGGSNTGSLLLAGGGGLLGGYLLGSAMSEMSHHHGHNDYGGHDHGGFGGGDFDGGGGFDF